MKRLKTRLHRLLRRGAHYCIHCQRETASRAKSENWGKDGRNIWVTVTYCRSCGNYKTPTGGN